jgi:hypothetical protein
LSQTKNLKKFEKTIDKSVKVWYNIYTVKERYEVLKMIRKELIQKTGDIYYEIIKILEADREVCFTKEEIFVRLPKDDFDVPLHSFNSMTNALRNLTRTREVEVYYVKGCSHYCFNPKVREGRY